MSGNSGKKRKKALYQYTAPYTPSAGNAFDNEKKTGVLLLNMGGPDDGASVRPFLNNLFADPDILRLPSLLQKPLAKYIVYKRGEEAEENYAKMSWGGGSPQLPLTRQQAAVLTAVLQQRHQLNVVTAIAMRYWHPFTLEALRELRSQGAQQVVVVSLYPHFSYTTTGSSLNELRRSLALLGWNVPISVIGGYCSQPWYTAAFAECITEGIQQGDWQCPVDEIQFLFSAHSLPLRHIKRTGDPYEQHTLTSIEAVMHQYFPNNRWDVAYQSKVGNFPWLGPPTDGVLSYYAGKKQDNILVIPVSFVSDHIETLVELDVDYIPQSQKEGISHIHRAPVMNTRPAFIEGLAAAIANRLHQRQKQSFHAERLSHA